ncbi:coiled-coil-helix-coiled-coil-helix domain-containing protein 7 isoform X4 [Neophocaena asiaeorientalis asiaeorientalis]|uniref:Coiled-coil-helix-coiled-coil-helix domain-containing protein 7 isoform X4 n=1 Tax=Neophocaena asiaeorientalis asiaeorientalis TaxID=1706337 RepID=A0A341B685_NEOAA|nr:coiled-coil-helix-coiled-coil-helix domain-containing protein 7 isoform X4 [Neophocaena asiaeorientalis asiaeorientalis]
MKSRAFPLSFEREGLPGYFSSLPALHQRMGRDNGCSFSCKMGLRTRRICVWFSQGPCASSCRPVSPAPQEWPEASPLCWLM